MIDFQIPNGGLAFWIRWRNKINLFRLSQQAAKNNLFIPKTLLYQHKNIQAMRIGFGNLNLMEIEKVIKILKLSAEQIQA
jgi:GntR family transcriptional regulator/MocR family aminotransferase